jgi:hypothetical protein
MPQIFWLGFGIAAAFVIVGAISGARSRTASLGSGAAMGAYLGLMAGFPLLAIGLATSEPNRHISASWFARVKKTPRSLRP